MILVTGATGIAGSQVVRALLEQRQDVRAFVRDPDKARGLFGDAADLAPGDFAEPRSLRAALRRRRRALPLGRRRSAAGRVGDSRDRCGGRSRRAPDRQALLDRRTAGSAGRVLGLARPDRAAPERLGGPRGDPPLELLHVEPAGRSRARGSRRQALRAGGRGADRDDRSPRRRRRRGGRSHLGRPRRPVVRPDRPRSRHLHAGRRSPRRGNRSRGRVRRPPRRGRHAGTDPGRPARVRRRAGRRGLRAGAARRRRPGHGDGGDADRPAPRDIASFARDSANLFSRREAA